MRLAHVVIRNFLSFRGETVFKLENAGLTLIEGANGSGKSSLVDALVWCLFGTTLRGYEGDEVINRAAGKDCVVMVTLTDHSKVWAVRRYRKHKEHKNALMLEDATTSTDLTKGTNTDTQAEVCALLGMTLTTFMSSVVFGQGSAYRFSALTDREQKAVLDEAMGIEQYASAGAAARDAVATHRTNVHTIRNELSSLTLAFETAQVQADELKTKEADHDVDVARRAQAVKDKLDELIKEIGVASSVDPEPLREQYREIERRLESQVVARDRLVEERATALTEAKTRRQEAEQLREKARERRNLQGECSTCGAAIDRVDQQHEAKQFDLMALDVEQVASDRTVRANHLQAEIVEIDKRRMKRVDRMKELRTQIDAAVKAQASVNALQARASEQQRRHREILAEKNPYAPLLGKARATMSDLDQKIMTAKTELGGEEEQLAIAEFWVEAYGPRGVRSLLMDAALPVLNAKAEEYAQVLTGGDVQIEFKTVGELKSGKSVDRFEVAVTNAKGAASYRGNSAGERARIDLCVGLALQALVAQRSRVSLNVSFWDEVFDNLDDEGVELAVTALANAASKTESMFVISHNETLKAFFPHVLRFEKTKDGTKIT